ncbi:MAG: hypothetical protein WBV82_09370, partial [Myxococcaceae bacterium]
ATLALPAAAFAQYEEHEKDARRWNVNGLAGVMSYAGEAASITQPGAAYGVTASGDIASMYGLSLDGEIGYLGGVYNSEALISSEKSTIVENGGQAAVKIGPELGAFEPYALGGVSVQRLNVVYEEATGGLIRDGTHTRIPVGVGFDLKPGGRDGPLTLGARGTYSFATNNSAFQALTPNTNSASMWTGLAEVGGSF